MRKTLAVAVLDFTATSLSAQTKRPATFDDVLNVKAIQGAAISPDGKQVVYGVRQWVSEQDKMESRTHIWKVATDGNSPTTLPPLPCTVDFGMSFSVRLVTTKTP